MKMVFLKAPLNVETCKNKLKDIPLPPESVITTWGSWLEAAIFYATRLKEIKNVVESFDEKGAWSNKSRKDALRYTYLQQDLTFTKKSLSNAPPETTKKLLFVGLRLTESIKLLDTIVENL